MVDKRKLKSFLQSDYSQSVKLFTLKALKGIMDFPTDNSIFLIYLYDLDLFEDGFFHLPKGQYYLIDFYYLEKLEPKIRDFYIDILLDGISIKNSFNLQSTMIKTTLLMEHGILISNIEYLKRKRQQKLDEVEHGLLNNFLDTDKASVPAKKLIDDDDCWDDDDF